VSAIDDRQLVAALRRQEPHYVHGVMECQRDPEHRRVHTSAGLVTPDGIPLVWLVKSAGHHDVGGVYGPALMLALFGHSSGGRYRHFLYGSTVSGAKIN
jgi:N-acetylglucosaminyldiphosphoundecaprenol N-acetyl-beta-D-mannosaminyltransferase